MQQVITQESKFPDPSIYNITPQEAEGLTLQTLTTLIYKRNPVIFVEDVLGGKPFPWQKTFLNAIRDNKMVSMRSGHGVGKSVSMAWAILWVLSCFRPTKIFITGSSFDNLMRSTWNEVKKWHG